MEKSWMPKTAGILDIIAGSLGIIVIFFLAMALIFIGYFIPAGGIPEWVPFLVGVIAIPAVLIDILAIVGGTFALKRKTWGVALAGSIAAIFSSFILGVVALIFTIIGKSEFR